MDEQSQKQTQETKQPQTEVKPQEQQAGNSAFTLQHDRPNCIGCAACEAVAPTVWEMNEDGKSDIKQGKNLDNGWQELDIDEKDYTINKEAADACPVNVIHLVNKKTGERII